MPSLIEGLKTKLGIPGRRKYDTSPAEVPFSGQTLKEKLRTLVWCFRIDNREQRIRRHTVWYLMALYYRGFQNVDLNPTGSSFDIFEKDDFYVENQFRKHVDTVKQLLDKMEGDVVVRPASDSPRDISTARAADPILQIQRDDIGYERLLDQKSLLKCLFGNAFIFNDYLTDKAYGSIVTPKYSYSEVQDPENPMEPFLSKTVTGYSTKAKGKQIATICSPLEINIRAEIVPFTSAPFIQWISRQDTETLNYLYPGLNMAGGISSIEQDLAQQYIEILGNLPGNVLGDSLAFNRGSSPGRKSELVRTWLQPCTFRGDTELEKEFPDGVHVTTIDGTVVDWYAENLCDRWTHEVLTPVPHSLLGDGLYDAILLQDQINEMDSLYIQHMRYTTVSHKVYDQNVIDSKDIVNDPRNGWIPSKPAIGQSIRDAVIDLPPNSLSSDVAGWRAAVLAAMQDMTGAYDPVTGKGIGANTPYSQSVFLSEKAQSRWQGSLSYNRPELIRFHRQLLESARQNGFRQQQAIIDNTGKWSFQQFSQADLQGDVDILLSSTDFKPRSRAEQIQGLQMLQQLAPIMPMLPPRQKLRVEEMLGLPPDANPTSNQIRRAYRHIERIKNGETITPLPMADDAQLQIPVYQDFLVSEDGEALAEQSPELYANIYSFMITLGQMAMSQMASPAAGFAAGGGAGAVQPGAGGSPPSPKQQPGGQLGQQGGGSPNPGGQAQSPQPAPPIPPSEANNQG